MERFRPYLGKRINPEKIKGAEALLREFNVTCTYLPDPPADFDEFEFRTGFSAPQEVVITLAVEKGAVKRVMFGLAGGDDPEEIRSLPKEQLEEFLSRRGGQMEDFFAFITG
ncbi:MAG: hypothetical protein ACUVSK_08720 [Desulfotomaculales bacterium]